MATCQAPIATFVEISVALPLAVILVHESLCTVRRVRRFRIAASLACANARTFAAASVLAYRTVRNAIFALVTVSIVWVEVM